MRATAATSRTLVATSMIRLWISGSAAIDPAGDEEWREDDHVAQWARTACAAASRELAGRRHAPSNRPKRREHAHDDQHAAEREQPRTESHMQRDASCRSQRCLHRKHRQPSHEYHRMHVDERSCALSPANTGPKYAGPETDGRHHDSKQSQRYEYASGPCRCARRDGVGQSCCHCSQPQWAGIIHSSMS